MERVRDYSSDEVAMLRMQEEAGIHGFPESIRLDEGSVIDTFLAEYPNARTSNETVRGFPLIIDETRRNLTETVGCTGVAYPTFDHPYGDMPSGYAFHTVNSDVQFPRTVTELPTE